MKLVLTSKPGPLGRLFAAVFVFLGVAFPVLIAVVIMRPARMATIDCDRMRGTCELSRSAWHRSIPVASVATVTVERKRGRSNSSASYFLKLVQRDGETFALTEDAYHEDVAAGFRHAALGVTAFLADAAAPPLKMTFVASDVDWANLLVFGALCPVFAWVFLRLLVTRRIEVDRPGHAVRVAVKPFLGRTTCFQRDVSDITGVRVWDGQRRVVFLIAKEGPPLTVLVMPRWMGKSSLGRGVEQLASALGVPIDISPAARASWGLKDTAAR